MGFFSALGKIGGFLPVVGPAISAISSVAGKQAQGKTEGQIAQAQLQQGQDRNAIDLYQAQQGAQNSAAQLDLQRKQFDNENRGKTAQQSLVAALLGGAGGSMDRSTLSGGKVSGGLFDALKKNPDAIAALRNLHGQADIAQMAQPSWTGGQLLQAPTLSALPKVDSGGWLSRLASIGQLVGAASPYLPGPQASVPNLPVTSGLPQVPGSAVGLSIPELMKKQQAEIDGDWSNR